MEWIVLAVIGVAVVLFVLYRVLQMRGGLVVPGRTGPGAEREGSATQGDEYPVLLNMVLGDREKAERLIDYERRKAPGADRHQLTRSAVERLRDDLRR